MTVPSVIAVGAECIRVASVRAFALSRGGSRLWVLTGLTTVPAKGLRHGEMPSELSVWSVVDAPRAALRFEASLSIARCAAPALAASDANEAVLMSSLGAMRFSYAKSTGIRLMEHLTTEETRGAAERHAWLRHAPFQLIDSVAGTCFNISANGAYSVERSRATSRLLVRRVADGKPLAESRDAATMAGAACVDDCGEVVLFSMHGKVHRWDVREGTTRVLEHASGEGLLALSVDEDVFAICGERVALHRLSNGTLLNATRSEPLGRSAVSHDLSRAVTLTPERLTTMSRAGDAWREEQSLTPVRHVLMLKDTALVVRDDNERARVDLVNRQGELFKTLHLPARVQEALALTAQSRDTASSGAASSFGSFVAAQKVGTRSRAEAALFALANGELAHLSLSAEPHVTLWNTGRTYAHTLALSEAHGLVAVGHGLKGGQRGKSYGGNAKFETADGVSLWSMEGTCLLNGLAMPSLASSQAIDARGNLMGLVGTSIYTYDRNAPRAGAWTPITIPLTWDFDAPAPRLLPDGQSVLTTVGGMLVVFDLHTRRETPIAPARSSSILAISGDSRRILLAHALDDRSELALYALDQRGTCLVRWPARATGCASLSYDGSEAILSGGDTLAEWVRF